MLAINFIACAWCVLLTLVSAADDLDEEAQQLKDDYEHIADDLDFRLDQLIPTNQMSAHLNTAAEFKDRRFIKFLNDLKSKTSCDMNMRSDLILLYKIMAPIPWPISSPFLSTIIFQYVKPKLEICWVKLETQLAVIRTSPWLKNIMENKANIGLHLRLASDNMDPYCYRKLADLTQMIPVVAQITGLNPDMRVNAIKMSYQFFKIQTTCKAFDEDKISGIISFMWDIYMPMGPNLDLALLTISICRNLRSREHLHVLKQQQKRGEIGNRPICWIFTEEETGAVKHARTPCPTNAKRDYEREIEVN